MKTLKIEIARTQIEAYKTACIAKGIRVASLNLTESGDHWFVTNYKPTNEAERSLIQSANLW